MVGINDFVLDEPIEIPILAMDPKGEARQRTRLKRLRRDRNQGKMAESILKLQKAAEEGDENLMPYILDCAKRDATLGEIADALREIYGEYEEPAMF